jgi:hypothetical protein
MQAKTRVMMSVAVCQPNRSTSKKRSRCRKTWQTTEGGDVLSLVFDVRLLLLLHVPIHPCVSGFLLRLPALMSSCVFYWISAKDVITVNFISEGSWTFFFFVWRETHVEALSSTLHSWGQNADMLMFLLRSWLQFVKTHLTIWLLDSEGTYSAETSGQLYERENPYCNTI